MASFKNLISNTSAQISSGGTITGDLVINGDLQVDGGGSLSFDEIIEGTQVIDVTNTEALLVRKDGDGGDVFIVDTTNQQVGVNLSDPAVSLHVVDTNNPADGTLRVGSGIAYSEFKSNASGTGKLIINNYASSGSSHGILFQSNGSTNMTLTAGGLLGIGENSPDELLHLKSSTDAKPVIKIEQSGDNINGGGLIFLTSGTANDNDDSGVIRFKGMNDAGTPEEIEYATIYVNHDDVSDGSEDATMHFRTQSGGSLDSRLVIKGSNVGIGSSAPNEGNLVVQDGTKAELVIKTSATATDTEAALMFKTSTDTDDIRKKGGIIYKDVGDNGVGDMFFVIDSATDNGNATVADNTAMVIKNSGNIGIGESSPEAGQLLHLKATSGSQILLQRTSADTSSILGAINFGASDGDEFLATIISQHDGATDSAYLAFQTEATGGAKAERMRIKSGGDVSFTGWVEGNDQNALFSSTGTGTLLQAPTSTEKILFRNANGTTGMLYDADNKRLIVGSSDNPSKELHLKGNEPTFRIEQTADANKYFDAQVGTGGGVSKLKFSSETHSNTLVVANNARVGINNGAPSYKLDVDHGAPSSSDQTIARFMAESSRQLGLVWDDSASTLGLATLTDHNLVFHTNGNSNPRMVIDNNSRISLSNNDSGADNTIFGFLAGASIGSGHDRNTLIGDYAGNAVQGDSNTIIGRSAGKAITVSNNTIVGDSALSIATTATENVVMGGDAMAGVPASVALTGAVAIGQKALKGSSSTTDGANYSVAVGYEALESLTTGDGNVALGYKSATSMTTGQRNVVIGYQAGDAMTIATRSVAIGYGALGTEDVGDRSIAIGFNSLFSQNSDSNNETTGNIGIGVEAGFYNQTGQFNTLIGSGAGQGASGQNHSQNTAVGYASLNVVTTGGNNVAMGMSALRALTSGSENVGIGKDCMYDANTASGVVAVGTESAYNITSGSESVAVGKQALYTATTVGANTAVGYQALKLNTVSGNTAVGHSALKNNSTATGNTAVGYESADAITTGGNNTAFGVASLGATDDGVNNTALGAYAMGGNVGTSNVAVGSQAMTDSTGSYNTALGMQSLFDCVAGGSNTVVGALAMKFANAGESNNIAIGVEAMRDVKENGNTADSNIAIGDLAMQGGTLAGDFIGNIAIGRFAMDATNTNGQTGTIAIGHQAFTALTSGAKNVAIGYKAGEFYNGSNSTIIGYEAGLDADGGATDSTLIGMEAGKHLDDATYNTAIGIEAMKSNSGGSNTAIRNTAIGWRAGDLIRTGSDNVVIGHGAEVSATDAVNQIAIGKETQGVSDNSVTLGNSDVTAVHMAQDSHATVYSGGEQIKGSGNNTMWRVVNNTMADGVEWDTGIDTSQSFFAFVGTIESDNTNGDTAMIRCASGTITLVQGNQGYITVDSSTVASSRTGFYSTSNTLRVKTGFANGIDVSIAIMSAT